jgi:hypothetical protein
VYLEAGSAAQITAMKQAAGQNQDEQLNID